MTHDLHTTDHYDGPRTHYRPCPEFSKRCLDRGIHIPILHTNSEIYRRLTRNLTPGTQFHQRVGVTWSRSSVTSFEVSRHEDLMHAWSALATARTPDDKSIFEGKRSTGFSNEKEGVLGTSEVSVVQHRENNCAVLGPYHSCWWISSEI